MGSEIAIIMGSTSDWPTMEHAANVLDALGVSYEAKVISAHRTPDRLVDFAKSAQKAGFKVIIAGCGRRGASAGYVCIYVPIASFGCACAKLYIIGA